MSSKPFYIFLFLGACAILYLSWFPDPRIGKALFFPKWLADWTDSEKNDTIRTGIPFLILGLVTGFRLMYLKSSLLKWLRYWAILVLIVILAELGQMLLPQRTSDWRDVAWGIIGTVLGMLIIAIFMGIRTILNYSIQILRK